MENAVQEEIQLPPQDVQEESLWEVFSEDSDFSESSEESSDEEFGDQVHRRSRSKRSTVP
jgi:hypothetical protein